MAAGRLVIDPTPPLDPTTDPYNTTAIDLRLHHEILIPKKLPFAIDLRSGGSIAELFHEGNYEKRVIHEGESWTLDPQRFILGRTLESVELPQLPGHRPLAARVEGRSGFARLGLLVHFTAPTIHAQFRGPIALEMLNLGPNPINLWRGAGICQLILEEVTTPPITSKSKFRGQTGPGG